MDVNGTRLHLVLGRGDWLGAAVAPIDEAVCFDDRAHTLGLRPRPFVFPTRPGAVRLRPRDRRGVAADRHGNIFWVAADRRSVQVLGAGRTAAFTWWQPPPEQARVDATFRACKPVVPVDLELAGLAITHDQYLVAGVRNRPGAVDGTSGLLVFDLAGGGPPVPLWWPDQVGVRVFDLAALPGGGLVVLDVPDPESPGPARLWQLAADLSVVDRSPSVPLAAEAPLFGALDAAETAVPTEAEPDRADRHVPLSAVTPAAAVELFTGWATAIDALPDGSVLVLDRQGAEGRFEVSRWLQGRRLPFRIRVDDDPAIAFACGSQRSNAREVLAEAIGHDLIIVPPAAGCAATSRLCVVDDRGDQAYEFELADDGADLVVDYHPLRLFGGRGLVVAGGVPSYDLAERWYPIPTRPLRRYASRATIELAPPFATGRGFDGGVPGTVWHRLVLDAVIPAGAAIEVESRAGDEPAALDRQAWRPEPTPYLRGDGSEIAYHTYSSGQCAGQGSWELLFQSAVGRYLQIRLTLRGDGRQSPRIWAVRAHFPRFSYLNEYLPAAYSEDRESASFLDRYLANVEGLYTNLEAKLAAVQRLVDPTTLDAEYLPWLASWLGATVEPDWEPARVRLFVRFAARMFTRRGTPRGLAEAIRLATDPCPSERIFDVTCRGRPFDVRVVEAFRTRAIPGVSFGNPRDLGGPRLVPSGVRWDLPEGGARLTIRWRDFLAARGAGGPTDFPVLTPTDGAAATWREFLRGQVGPTYADVGAADLGDYRRFLEQRYGRPDDLRVAWNLTSAPGSFADIGLPTALPPDGAALQDWITFVSAVLPARRAAHRAVVLVPMRIDESDDERERRLGRVRRVVATERPAHTLVDVQSFWAALRVGEARVGLETVVGKGGRFVELVLGRDRLAQAVVPGGDTWRLDDRLVVGRDRIEQSVEIPTRTGGRR